MSAEPYIHLKNAAEIAVNIATVLGGAVAAFWAYTRFVLEQGSLPPVEPALRLRSLGLWPCVGNVGGGTLTTGAECRVVEVTLRLRNVGRAALLARDVTLRIRYHAMPPGAALTVDQRLLKEDGEPNGTFARVLFEGVLTRDLTGVAGAPSALAVVPWETFVLGGVAQDYTLTTVVPRSATLILVHGAFTYRPMRGFRLAVWRLARALGFVSYTLDQATEPHTIERVFRLRSAEEIGIR